MKVKELLTDKHRWIKGGFARNASGDSVNSRHPEACRWCLLGAVYKCYDEKDRYGIFMKIQAYIGSGFASDWNDHPARTFDEVGCLVEALDI